MSEYKETGKRTKIALRADVQPQTARKYIETGQSPAQQQAPHTWRTRPDPLAQVREEVAAMLRDAPESEAKVHFLHFLARPDGELAEAHLRTFRRERKQQRLLRESKLPAGKTLGNLAEGQLPAKVRRQLPTLLEGCFVERAKNVLVFGLPGRGKTHFLCALGRELVVRRGYAACFTPTFKLGRLRAHRTELFSFLQAGLFGATFDMVLYDLTSTYFESSPPFPDRDKRRHGYSREGRYLLRINLTETDPAKLWEFNLQLVEVEAAFKRLNGDLALRPSYHQREDQIEAQIFVAFLGCCLHGTLRAKLRGPAPGLTPRAVLEKFATLQMPDVHFPTTDDRELIITRYTQPEKEQRLLLSQLAWTLPAPPPPQITAKRELQM